MHECVDSTKIIWYNTLCLHTRFSVRWKRTGIWFELTDERHAPSSWTHTRVRLCCWANERWQINKNKKKLVIRKITLCMLTVMSVEHLYISKWKNGKLFHSPYKAKSFSFGSRQHTHHFRSFRFVCYHLFIIAYFLSYILAYRWCTVPCTV